MPQVEGTAFLQSVGYAIINSFWQYAILWLLYATIISFFTLSARQKYISGFTAQLLGFTWFLSTFIYYFFNPVIIQNHSEPSSLLFSGKLSFWLSGLQNLLPFISLVYLTVLLFAVIRWSSAYKQTLLLRKKELLKVDVEWRLFVEKLATQLGIKQRVIIHLSKLVNSPLTLGYFKPIILLPFTSVNHLSTEQMEAVILHELAHIKRYDYLFNLLLVVIDVMLFFNPFMHLLGKNIKKERENSCDDLVLQFQYSPAAYAGALLQIASAQQSSAPLFALQAADRSHFLLERIKRIIGNADQKKRYSFSQQVIAALFVVLAVLSFLVMPNYAIKNKRSSVVTNEKNDVVEDYRLLSFISSAENIPLSAFKAAIKQNNIAIEENNSRIAENEKQKFIQIEKPAENIFYEVSDEDEEINIIQAVHTSSDDNKTTLEEKIMQDITSTIEQAKAAKKDVDVITLKSMMLARVQKMIEEKEMADYQEENMSKQRLQMIEKKIATDVISNIMISKNGSVEKVNDQLKIQYLLPEDGSGNNYAFEYFINPSEKEKCLPLENVEKAEVAEKVEHGVPASKEAGKKRKITRI